MTAEQSLSFDLDEGMIKQIEEEFGPEALRAAIKQAGAKGVDDAFFAGFGRRWMERTLELGEAHGDRTYDALKAAAEKTGYLAFPFVPQRFIEIAYLGTQPIYTLPIVENSAFELVFKMPFCGYYKVIREELGDAVAGELHCREACLSACRLAFEQFGFAVDAKLEATMPADEYCQFSVRPA